MRKLVGVAVLAIALVALARPAFAVPAIDGTMSAGEWDAFDKGGVDPNESDITDNWDIHLARIIQEDSGGGDDGFYFLLTTFDPPTFAGGPGSFGDEAFFQFAMDFDGDGLITSADDRVISFNQLGTGEVRVRAGDGTFLGLGVGALGDVVEFSAAEALFPGGSYKAFARLDGNGDEPDDRIPNAGFFTPIPEPGSAMLLGLGLMGGLVRRRRSTRS